MLEMKDLENVTALDSVPTETLLTEKVNGKAAAMPEDALQMVAESEIQEETSQTDVPSPTLGDAREDPNIDPTAVTLNEAVVATKARTETDDS